MTVQNKASILFIFFTSCVCIYTFNVKYRAIALADNIKKTQNEIKKEKKQRKILRAEWQALTAPSRIKTLAKKFLDSERNMEPVRLHQGGENVLFVKKTIAELGSIIDMCKTDGN